MTSASLQLDNAGRVRFAWLLPSLTLLLAVLALAQVVFLVPASVRTFQSFGVLLPWYMELTRQTPVWIVAIAAAAAVAWAFWQRRSTPRAAVVATAALAVNLAILLSICGTQFKLLSALSN